MRLGGLRVLSILRSGFFQQVLQVARSDGRDEDCRAEKEECRQSEEDDPNDRDGAHRALPSPAPDSRRLGGWDFCVKSDPSAIPADASTKLRKPEMFTSTSQSIPSGRELLTWSRMRNASGENAPNPREQ